MNPEFLVVVNGQTVVVSGAVGIDVYLRGDVTVGPSRVTVHGGTLTFHGVGGEPALVFGPGEGSPSPAMQFIGDEPPSGTGG